MKTLSELQIIAEGKYPESGMGFRDFVMEEKRISYVEGCLDTQEESGDKWQKLLIEVEDKFSVKAVYKNKSWDFNPITE